MFKLVHPGPHCTGTELMINYSEIPDTRHNINRAEKASFEAIQILDGFSIQSSFMKHFYKFYKRSPAVKKLLAIIAKYGIPINE